MDWTLVLFYANSTTAHFGPDLSDVPELLSGDKISKFALHHTASHNAPFVNCFSEMFQTVGTDPPALAVMPYVL
jgi:hypothetical protein